MEFEKTGAREWSQKELNKIAKATGLTTAAIYKWNWDMRDRKKPRDLDLAKLREIEESRQQKRVKKIFQVTRE